jgi:ribosomal protein L32E
MPASRESVFKVRAVEVKFTSPEFGQNFEDNYGQLRKVWQAPFGRKRHQRKHLDFTPKIS